MWFSDPAQFEAHKEWDFPWAVISFSTTNIGAALELERSTYKPQLQDS